MKLLLKLLTVLALGTLPIALHASSLAGQSGTFQLETTKPLSEQIPPQKFIVGDSGISQYTISTNSCRKCLINKFSPAMIEIEFNGASAFSTTVMPGEMFTLPDFDITGVGFITNFSGLSKADVTFDIHDIFVDWQGLRVFPGRFIDLTVQGHSDVQGVPEPGGLVLLGTGLLGAATLLRRLSN